MEATNEQLSYIAGFFDGEGCITPSGHYLNLQINAANTDLKPLEFVRNILGGRVLLSKGQVGTHKAVYRWHIGGKDAAVVLSLLMPYLIVKRERALLGIKLAFAEPRNRVDIAVKIRILNH